MEELYDGMYQDKCCSMICMFQDAVYQLILKTEPIMGFENQKGWKQPKK